MVTDWSTDWLIGWLIVWLGVVQFGSFTLCITICLSVVCWVVYWYVACIFVCWVVISLYFRLIALPFLQSDLLQVFCERNSSRPSWSKWIVSNRGGTLPHCKWNYSGYRLPLVQENCSQRNFYPYYNRCEKCRSMKFSFDVNYRLFHSHAFLFRSFPVPSFWCILCFHSILNPIRYNLYDSPNICSLGCFSRIWKYILIMYSPIG